MTTITTNWTAIRELAEDLEVLATDVAGSSPDHGPRHWRDVARTGLGLWAEGVDIKQDDLAVVLLFAMLHDTQRLNEFEDPDHGRRAATLASKLGNSGRLLDWLDGDRAMQLDYALAAHNDGDVADPYDNVAVATCWDSDRLTLMRVGITPNPKYLSNEQAKGQYVVAGMYGLMSESRDFGWDQIIDAYEKVQPLDVLNPALVPQLAAEYRNVRLLYGDGLHPDLRIDRDGPTLTILRNKFVQDVYMGEAMHVHYNARYLGKRAHAEKLLAAKEWTKFILTHEKPYRLDAIHECIGHGMVGDEVARQVGSHWTHCENIHEQRDEWIDLWEEARAAGHLEVTMDEEERRALADLPQAVTVYRGFNRRDGEDGLSWTTDRQKAIWFAKRYSTMGDINASVAEGMVDRDDILAYFLARDESEVVVLPENVRIDEIWEVE